MAATTFAGLFGAVFPAEAEVETGVIYGPTGDEFEGTFAGGGTGDALEATSQEILAAVQSIKGTGWGSSTDTLEKIRDAISLLASISVVIPSPVTDVVGMPDTLEIGDSYDDETPIKL